jgi:hypothetical protein
LGGSPPDKPEIVESWLPAIGRVVHVLLARPLFAFALPHGSEWILIFAFFILFGPVLWIAALVSCVRNESSTGNTKLTWVIIIVALHVFGALLYFLLRRPQRIRELGR